MDLVDEGKDQNLEALEEERKEAKADPNLAIQVGEVKDTEVKQSFTAHMQSEDQKAEDLQEDPRYLVERRSE